MFNPDEDPVQTPPEGPDALITALYRRHHGAVLGFCLRQVADYEDARELAQRAFLIAWKRIDRWDRSKKASTWLMGIARNLQRHYHRGDKRRQSFRARYEPVALLAEELPRPSSFERLSAEQLLSNALQALPPEQREVVTRRYLDDLDAKEIAEALGIPEGTVKSRLRLAQKKLKPLFLPGSLLPGFSGLRGRLSRAADWCSRLLGSPARWLIASSGAAVLTIAAYTPEDKELAAPLSSASLPPTPLEPPAPDPPPPVAPFAASAPPTLLIASTPAAAPPPEAAAPAPKALEEPSEPAAQPVAPTAKEQERDFLKRAVELQSQGQLYEAEETLNDYLAQHPEGLFQAQAQFRLMELDWAQGDWQEVIEGAETLRAGAPLSSMEDETVFRYWSFATVQLGRCEDFLSALLVREGRGFDPQGEIKELEAGCKREQRRSNRSSR